MRQCPFPVHSTDNRRSYRAGSMPGLTLALAMAAALLGHVGFSDAAPVNVGAAGVAAGPAVGAAAEGGLAAARRDS